ncbi:hypothetical protein FNV43_RR01331 [Rhamnella rubrinervis]|uniref:Uncharacterized protein n=1 Tax=Rhamnella rubrinervis TaxID=2594499 RepID=A0A8K0HPF0_9ROSA|nr:hypothetical protein FNV43_RR01331 [Rhamnella rubrinervis]
MTIIQTKHKANPLIFNIHHHKRQFSCAKLLYKTKRHAIPLHSNNFKNNHIISHQSNAPHLHRHHAAPPRHLPRPGTHKSWPAICKAPHTHRCRSHLRHQPLSPPPHDQILHSHRLVLCPFSDGYDDGSKPGDDMDHHLSEISRCGSQALYHLVVTAAKEGRPFSFIVYSILLPWAAETANKLHVPSALLWIQPATVFDIYYYYFHDYSDTIDNTNSDSTDGISCFIELPGLPLKLTKRDLPSFMDAGNTYTFAIPLFKAQFEILDKESNPKVLLNTFDALEPEALRATSGKYDLIGIGPLIPSAFLDGKDPSDTSFGGDFVQHSKDYYMEWLNKKPKDQSFTCRLEA